MNAIVKVDSLRKVYGSTVAVDGISFTVHEGEIFGIVGPNGAGKTTTIECLEGLRKPDTGLVRVLGVDPHQAGQTLCLRAGMQLQQSNLQDRIKVWEALDLYASFYPQTVDWEELLTQLGLAEKRNAYFAQLSGGQKQRLFIALALLSDPPLIFLDELTTGLDPHARHAIWELVRDVRARGKTVILSTHFMEEAERLCDRVAILDHGKIVALDTPGALIRRLNGEERVIFRLDESLSPALQKNLSNLGRVEFVDGELTVRRQNGCEGPLVVEVVGLLTAQGIAFRDLHTEQLIMLFIFGTIYSSVPAGPESAGAEQGIGSLIPAFMSMVIGIVGLMAVTITMATYRENGILRRLRTTPVSPLIVMAAQVIVVFVMTTLGVLLLVAAGMLVYHVTFEGSILSLLAGFVLSCLSFFGIGFILAGVLPTARTAQVVAMVLLYPMLILSGAAWPRELMPAAIERLSAFLPLTYVVNLLRGLWTGASWGSHLLDVAVLAGMLLLGVFISTKTFRWE